MANDLILVNLGGGQHSLLHNPVHFSFIFNKIWEASLTNLSQELRISLIDHSNAVTRPVLETVASASEPLALRVPQPPGNGSLLLLLPIFRVMDLIKLYVRSPGHHHVYQRLNDTFVNVRNNTLVKC